MKKKMSFFILLLMAVMMEQALGAENPANAVSELAVSSFQKIVVNAHIDVVLVQRNSLKKAYIEGDANLVPEVSVTVSKGVLTIAARRQVSYRGKVRVTISVEELTKLVINADADVVSLSPLRSPKIAVAINSHCDLHLKSTGKILVKAGIGYSLKYLNQSPNDTVIELSAEIEG
jgi:Putative auto-transporter adhesin, head GIN domain